MAFKHAITRLYLYLLFGLFFITGGLALFLLAPLYKGAFAPSMPFREFSFTRSWAHMYKVIWRSITDSSYRGMYSMKLTDPPKQHTDRALVCIHEDWQGEEGNCDACEKSCCERLECPLFAENGRCAGYDSIFFSYFFCGRYPENQSQINYYECPKWKVKE